MATSVGSIIFSISADLKSLQGQLRTMEGNFNSSFNKIGGQAKAFGVGLLSSLGASLSVGALIGFTKGALDAIGNLHDLADQTGFAATTLLKLKPILNDAGTSSEEFAKGINALQKEIIGGSAEVVAALQKMGLSIDDMLASADDPEGLVDKLAKGFANLATQAEKVAVARTLLARGGPKIAVALAEIQQRGGLAGIPEDTSITNEQIEAIDRLGRKFDEVKIKAEVFAAVKFLDLVDGLVAIQDQLQPIVDLFKFLASVSTASWRMSVPIPSLGQNEAAGVGTGPQQAGSFRNFPTQTTAPQNLTGFTFTQPGTKPPSTITETDQQREFKKSLEQTIEGLKAQALALTQSKEASIAAAAGILQTKAATLGLAKDNADLIKQLNEFKRASLEIAQAQLADQLVQQNRSIEANIASMTEGAQAAEELAIRNSLLASKLDNVGRAALEAAQRQRELNAQQARAAVPEALRVLGEGKEIAARKKAVLGITFNADEETRASLEQTIDKLVHNVDPRVKALALEAAFKLKPELDAATLASIKTDLDKKLKLDVGFGALLNKTFTNSFDLAAAKVDNIGAALQEAKTRGVDPLSAGVQKLAADFDKARLDQATSNVVRDLQIAANEAEVFGRSFDLGAANISAIQAQLENLIRAGLSPANAEAQKLAAQLAAAKVDSTFRDLAKELDTASKEAQVFGGAFDQVAANIDALTAAIKRLIAEGLDPLDPRIQELKKQLDDQKAFQKLQDAAERAFDVIEDLINGNIKSWKDLEKSILGSLRAISSQILKEAARDFIRGILKPPPIPPQGGPAGTKRDSGGLPVPDIRGSGPLVKGPITEPVSEATAVAKGSGEITVAAAGLQTASTSFQSATAQFAAAVQQFAATVSAQLPTSGTPGTNFPLSESETLPIGTSLGLNPDTLTGDLGVTLAKFTTDSHAKFMADATAISKTLEADLSTAIASGSSLGGRAPAPTPLAPVEFLSKATPGTLTGDTGDEIQKLGAADALDKEFGQQLTQASGAMNEVATGGVDTFVKSFSARLPTDIGKPFSDTLQAPIPEFFSSFKAGFEQIAKLFGFNLGSIFGKGTTSTTATTTGGIGVAAAAQKGLWWSEGRVVNVNPNVGSATRTATTALGNMLPNPAAVIGANQEEIIRLGQSVSPQTKVSYSNLPGVPGEYNPRADEIILRTPERMALAHEYTHALEHATGIGRRADDPSQGMYAPYGAVPDIVGEGAADRLSGTSAYLPRMSLEQISQSNAIAEMLQAAAKEQEALKESYKLVDEWSSVADDGFKKLDSTVVQGLDAVNQTSTTGFSSFFSTLASLFTKGLGSLSGGSTAGATSSGVPGLKVAALAAIEAKGGSPGGAKTPDQIFQEKAVAALNAGSIDDRVAELRQQKHDLNPEIGTSLNLNPNPLTGDSGVFQDLADEGVTAIEAAQSAAEKGIAETGGIAKTGIGSLLTTALQALTGGPSGITNAFTGGASSGLSGLSGGLAGGILGNLLGTGGSATTGFGSRPEGVLGPTMANGGFFSSALGAIMSYFGFGHEGGELADIAKRPFVRFHTGGEISDDHSIHNSQSLVKFHGGGDLAHRFMQNLQHPQLRHDEGIFIGKNREFIINDKSAMQVGKPVLEFINREGRLPDSGEGGASEVAGVSESSITTDVSTSMPTYHLGGDITLPRYHLGGDVTNSSTRFVTNDWMNSSSSINNSSLTSQIQNMLDLDTRHATAGPADMRPMKAELHVHGVHDVEGFRRSRPQLEADFGRMMARAQKRT